MPDELTDSQIEQIREEIRSGNKLVAVKLYKDWTGSSLVAAKNYVEGLSAEGGDGGLGLDSNLDGDQMDEILDAIGHGRKLNAVKLYKDASGASLRDAKVFIEKLMKELEIEDTGGAQGGCMTVILVSLVIAAGVAVQFA